MILNQTTLIDIGAYAALLLAGFTAGWLLRMWRATAVPAPPDATTTRFELAMSRWRRMTQAAEGTLLDNVAATTPWLAPLLPASIAYANMREWLGFDVWLAFVGALVIEFLGLAAVHTSFQLWQYNETKNQSEEAAPFYWAVGAVVVYLGIVILVNVILEAANVTAWTSAAVASIAAKALLSLLSIVAAFVLALRSQHARRLAVKQEAHEDRQRAVELGRLRKEAGQLRQVEIELKNEVETLRQQIAEMQTQAKRQVAISSNGHGAATSRQDRRQVLDKLPTDWRQLTPKQRHDLAHATREDREKMFPELATRTRREWHTRLDELAAQDADFVV